jgi:hypothetical protein
MVQGVGIHVPVEVKQSMRIFIFSSGSEDGNNVAVIIKNKRSPNK